MRSNLCAVFAGALVLLTTAAWAGPDTMPAKKAEQPPMANPTVVITTSMGVIKAELFKDKAPLSVENFLAYTEAKFFDGTIFHRVIPNFMIQGGGMTPDLERKQNRAPIKLESDNGLTNDLGTLAMARTGVPDSATSQFFINVADNKSLNYNASTGRPNGYAVFGKVIEGMEVVEKIKAVKTGTRSPHQNVPIETVTIESIRLAK